MKDSMEFSHLFSQSSVHAGGMNLTLENL